MSMVCRLYPQDHLGVIEKDGARTLCVCVRLPLSLEHERREGGRGEVMGGDILGK